MATVAIILLVVIIIYTLYAIFWDKPKNQPSAPVQRKTTQKAVEAKKQTEAKAPQPAKEAEKSSKAPVEEKVELPAELVNPKTGERASLPNNYRFAKRWIKEALVEEGLLPKIYKNNELDDAANKKIKKALGQLATNKKYQD